MNEAGPAGRAATRVVDAQRQAARTLAVAAAFTAGAALSAPFPHDTGRWLPLHLFLLGGLLSAISGATQLLSVTWSAAPAPPDRWVSAQRWLLAAGALAVAIGREVDAEWVTVLGGVAVGLALGLLAGLLVSIRGSGTVDRFRPAIDAYLTAVAFSVFGVGLGVAVVTTDPSSWWVRMRDAHPAINLHGLVGLVIVGTLPYFAATQARTKMSRRATPLAMRTTAGAMSAAVALTATGHLLDRDLVTAAGYTGIAVAVAATAGLLPAVGPRQLRWAGARLLQLGAGIAWWIGATVLLAVAELDSGVDRNRALAALVVGGFAQILVASLAYFGPVLRAGGHRHLTAGFAVTRSWPSLVAGNLAAVALLAGWGSLARVVLVAWALDIVVRAVLLVTARPPEATSRGAGDAVGAPVSCARGRDPG